MTTAGHNSKAENERRVLFSYYHRKDRDIDAKIMALQADKKSNRQNAKASGFPAQKLDHYLKVFKSEDQQKPLDRHRSDRENLIWLGLIPDDPKGDLLADRATNEQMIQANGFHAGLTGSEAKSGYDGGSVEDRLWMESYHAGRAEYDTTIPDILARAEAARTNEEPASTGDPFPAAAE